MRQHRPVVATTAALLLAGCSGGLGSVQGHDIPVNQAVFLDLGNNRLFLAVGNPDNLCDLVTGAVRPGKGFAVLFTEFANWDGTTTQPLMPGRYVQSTVPGVPGLVSLSVVQWGDGCIALGTLQASSGSVSIESLGAMQAGAHVVANVDLKFADDHLSGRVDAVYCPAPASPGNACGP
jgi:hypothetical protein